MTRRINIELDGGPWDGRRIDDTLPWSHLTGTWGDDTHHTYTPTGTHTQAGRHIYRHLTPTHPSLQRRTKP